jgi:hypothetical protein
MFIADQDADMWLDGVDTDFDRDGLPDYHELTMIVPGYTYGGLGDENSTARNYKHLLNHTICTMEDTDGDGYSDGYEINFGSDPLNKYNLPYSFFLSIVELGYDISFRSASEVSGLMFDGALGALEFDVSGPDDTRGFCNVTIPRGLLYSPIDEWDVLLDEEPIGYTATVNETHTFLFFEYMHSDHHVSIQGLEVLGPPAGFDPLTLIVIGSLAGVAFIIILLFVLKKKKT